MKQVMVPIDKAGRIVLPKDIRQELALNTGDLLKVSVEGDGVTLQPQKVKGGLIRKGSGLVFTTGSDARLTRETVNEILQQVREEREDRTIPETFRRKHAR